MYLSVVIPVYNSENIVEKTLHATTEVLNKTSYSYEIILINDGSTDESWNIIRRVANASNNVIAINLLKNYGQHSAVMCGFKYARGEYVITMDDDLQNPPSEIPKLVDKISDGYDLVFAEFKEKKHAPYRKFGSKIIGYVNEKIFDKPKQIVLTNFRIIHSNVIERVLKHRTVYPYIPGLLVKYASKIANIRTDHEDRFAGKSNYGIIEIAKLVARLLFNYSSYPLKLLTQIGFTISSISFLIGIYFVVKRIIAGISVPGWTSLIVLLSFLNGFIIIMLGVLGEFVTRILKQTSNESAYIIDKIVGNKE